LRWDETDIMGGLDGALPMRRILVENLGMTFCCADCQADIEDRPRPQPKRWESPTPILGDWTRFNLPVCGICRHALPHQQMSGKHITLPADILTDEDGLEPGGYAACQECIRYWKTRGGYVDGQVPRVKGNARIEGEIGSVAVDEPMAVEQSFSEQFTI